VKCGRRRDRARPSHVRQRALTLAGVGPAVLADHLRPRSLISAVKMLPETSEKRAVTLTKARLGGMTSVRAGLGARRDGQVSYGTQRGPLRAAAVRP
jgi:hypothetical protein